MILKGFTTARGQAHASHLMRSDDNEHVLIQEVRGFVSDNLHGAFKEAQAVAGGTKCEKFLFSCIFAPPKSANLSVDQFMYAIDKAKQSLGLTGQPRAVVFHEKDGGRHAHCVWSRSAGFLAGYGMKLMPIIQNIGQIKNLYERNWETFLGNAGAIIAFGLNDAESEKYVADRIGRLIHNETTQSLSASTGGQLIGGSANAGMNWNTARHERPIRFPNEIHEQGARETGRAFVIPASGRAFTVRRQNYFALPKGTFEPPEFIHRWEEQFSSVLSQNGGG